jgi:hypothetical protein
VLLQGLLDDARGMQPDGTEAAAATGDDADDVLLLDDGAMAEDGDDWGGKAAAERSTDSEVMAAAAAAAGDPTASSAAAGRAVLASHSLYKLVLRTASLEVHLHVRVYDNYPLLPPMFQVTKLFDLREDQQHRAGAAAAGEVIGGAESCAVLWHCSVVADSPCKRCRSCVAGSI